MILGSSAGTERDPRDRGDVLPARDEPVRSGDPDVIRALALLGLRVQ